MSPMGGRGIEDPGARRAGRLSRWRSGSKWRSGGRRAAWRRARIRRLVSALLVAVAAWLVTGAVLPDPPDPGVPVVIAADDLPAGHVLSADDLRVDRWPRDIRPPGAVRRVDHAVGRTLAGPLGAGEPVTPARTHDSALLRGLPKDRVLAYLPADGGLSQVLQPGDHIDAVSTADGSTVAADLLVVRSGVFGSGDPKGSGTIAPPASEGARGVLVATTPHTAARLAEARGTETPGVGVMLTLHRPE